MKPALGSTIARTLEKKKVVGLLTSFGALALVLILGLQPVTAAQTPVTVISSAGWMISQAAGQSQGTATQVLACGTFSLTVSSTSTNPAASSGTFSGTLAFVTSYNTGIPVPPSSVPVSGSWLRNPATHQLMVSFSAAPPSILTGSFSSPASSPQPSTPPLPSGYDCGSRASGLFGFVQLPITQQSEGVFLYSTTQVNAL